MTVPAQRAVSPSSPGIKRPSVDAVQPLYQQEPRLERYVPCLSLTVPRMEASEGVVRVAARSVTRARQKPWQAWHRPRPSKLFSRCPLGRDRISLVAGHRFVLARASSLVLPPFPGSILSTGKEVMRIVKSRGLGDDVGQFRRGGARNEGQ